MNKYYNVAKNELFSILKYHRDGIRKSLIIIKNNFQTKVIKIKSGKKSLIGKFYRWNIKDAFVKIKGNKIIV